MREIIYRVLCWLKAITSLFLKNPYLRIVEETFKDYNNGLISMERKILYRGLKWRSTLIPSREIGIWDEAQGIPHEWCENDILTTVRYFLVYSEQEEYQNTVFYRKIKELLKEENSPILEDHIILVDGRLRRGRLDCRQLKYSIDDGCMRAMAKIMKGFPLIKAYVGEL